MMRSLFSGVAGLRNHQLRMDIIGNNIANVNTVGYKKTRANFGEMLVQTLRGASAPQAGRGGSNAQQVGLGVTLSSVDSIFLQGSPQTTGKQTDLFIQGEGFFVLSDGVDLLFTRAGNFDTDRDGNLIDKATGLKVMGWMADSAGNIDTTASVTGLNIPIGKTYPPTATTSITYAGNLDAGAAAGTTKTTSIDIYDAQGAAHRIITTFTKASAANTWNYTLALDQGDSLIQNYIKTYYGSSFSTLPQADQSAIVDKANGAYLGGTSVSGLGVTAVGAPGVVVYAYQPPVVGLQVGTDATRPSSATIASPTTVRKNGNVYTVHLAKNTAGTVTATLDDVKNALNAGANAYLTNVGGGGGITVEARTAGAAGNSIQIEVVDTGGGGGPVVAVTGSKISVDLKGGANLSQVVTAINGHPTAGTMVYASLTGADGAAAGYALANLANGVNATDMPFTALVESGANGGATAAAEGPLSFTTSTTSARSGQIIFASSGTIDTAATQVANGVTGANLTKLLAFSPLGTNQMSMTLDLKSLSQYFGAHSANAVRQNGNPSGTLQTVNVAADGTVSGVFSNGFTMGLGTIALSAFNNPAGLIRVGDNMYKESANSGTRQVGTANTGGRGTIIPGALEMSNVDLAQEFTDMIMTQRGFQANTRVITVSDEMLNELANLKR